MHVLWKGSITFGLVSVPVKLHSATEEKEITFKTVHRPCGTPINQVRNCSTCHTQVDSADVVKGFEYEKGRIVLLEKAELDQILPEASKEIRVLHFMQRDEINPLHYQKTYFLSPDTLGVNGYQLLLAAMNQSKKIAICKLSIRSKSSLAAIQSVGECLTLTTMYYPDEIRSVEAVPNLRAEAKIERKGIELAQLLIEQMSKPYTAADYRNDSREQLISYIQEKIAGNQIIIPPQASNTTILDLMSALQASIEAIQADKKSRGAKRTKASKKNLESIELPGSTETA
ncbi:Ku protein [Cohnella sp. AR92]|uniref:non-homologous end joining protein Ku n=1 Tax=Cohnella sp. AR92 TaxID=648716 RepID=UPI0013153C79|nr:Ku protein [Cohnella sp. AR92]